MRHSLLRSVLFSVALAGCVTGSDDQRHGPVFEVADTGVDRAPVDDAATPSADATTSDAGTLADVAVAPDAPIEKDAVADGVGPHGCPSQVAVIAGNGSSLYQSLFTGAGPWNTSFASTALLSTPAVVGVGSGFHAVVRTTSDLLKFSTSSGAQWSPLAGIGASTTTAATPALAASGANVHLVYLGSNSKFYHGIFTANAWDTASDPVGGTAAQSFGPTPPGAAAIGGSLVIAQAGSDHLVYDQSLSGTGWLTAHQQAGAQVGPIRPAICALDGAASDVMVVFVHQTDNKISFITHATGGTWSAPAMLDGVAASADPVSLAPMSGGRAVVVFRSAADQKAYFSVYSATTSPQWTSPALLAGAAAVAAPGVPAVATGVCGDDAIAAFPLTGDNVQVVRLRGATWTAGEAVTATSSATAVAIATVP